ncbi:MAG TPA: methyltransferase domain-containing protein [Thermoanaerobaculia bacterium]
MHETHVTKLLDRLAPTDLVLDVGGWACPFNRAQWILDAQPYDSRGFYRTFGGPPSQGGDREWFTRETWVQHDICSSDPWPFTDKQFDFAICSHTLEDLRDPLRVCRELNRVAKAGYIEVPSRLHESIMGLERPGQVGLSHHRWLIEIAGNHIRFMQKYHMIHADWRFHIPHSYRSRITPDAAIACLWWDNSFTYEEVEVYGVPAQERELAEFVQKAFPRPEWTHRVHAAVRGMKSLVRRGRSWFTRKVLRGAAETSAERR